MSRIERWSTRIIITCAIGTCGCFAGLGYLHSQVSGQAERGERARDRQQRVWPVSLKVYEDAWKRGVITERDLACFRATERCPPLPTPTP